MENIAAKMKRLLLIQIKYLWHSIRISGRNYTKGVTCIIFSRDRAMQLDFLLASMKKFSKTYFPVVVQYSCSESHTPSYDELIRKYPEVNFVKETTVRETLIKLLRGLRTEYMFYLVDDQVFISEFDIQELLGKLKNGVFASMRLGETITNWGIKDVAIRGNYREDGDFLHWRWNDNKANHDWGYQFSVDGTIYRTVDILRCSLSIPFKAPNSYEANMNSVMLFKSNNRGVSFKRPVVVNLIINASRQEKGYENCEAGEYTADDLLKLYQSGKTFDFDKVAAIPYCSSHHIINDINSVLKDA